MRNPGDFLLSERSPRVRGTATYTKPALSEDALLDRWVERGLILQDRERVRRYLRHIGYYRLSGYVRSFEEDGQRPRIRPGTTFDDALGLYVFDRKLRLVMLDALERVEVAVRAAMSDQMSRLGGPHWYEDPQYFSQSAIHRRLLKTVDDLVEDQLKRPAEKAAGQESSVSALDHYVTRYGEPVRPPTWLAFEELSLGSLRSVYGCLANQSVKADIAVSVGLRAPVLASWLQTYQRVRNICAHHGRLWNRGLGVYPMIPTSRSIRWLVESDLFTREPWRRQRLYPVIVSLQTVLHTIAPGSSWAGRLRQAIQEHPAVPLSGMGIPEGWHEDPFWPKEAFCRSSSPAECAGNTSTDTEASSG